MKKLTPLTAAVIAILAGGIAPAAETQPTAADREERPLSFEFGTGVQYDSNVAVLELDSIANAGDTAALLEFGAGYDKPSTGRLGVSAGYDFSQTLHEDFDGFDVGIHRGSGTLSYDLDRVDIGTTFQYAHAELDGSEFLVLQQASPYLSKLVGDKLFLRFAYARSDKDFARNPGRDASADAVTTNAYVFLNGLTTYLTFGHRYHQEDSLDPQFDYSSNRLTVQLSKRLPAGGRTLTLKTGMRYESRDYEHPTIAIGVPRDEDRYQLEATAEFPLTERILTRIGYKHADNRSNLQALDFDENVVSLTFRATL